MSWEHSRSDSNNIIPALKKLPLSWTTEQQRNLWMPALQTVPTKPRGQAGWVKLQKPHKPLFNPFFVIKKNIFLEFLLWHYGISSVLRVMGFDPQPGTVGLRIQHCHNSGTDHNRCSDLIHGLEASTGHWCGQKHHHYHHGRPNTSMWHSQTPVRSSRKSPNKLITSEDSSLRGPRSPPMDPTHRVSPG